MCRAVTCRTCGKTTWSGCGHHVNPGQGRVPVDQWCPGHPDKPHHGILSRLTGR